MNGQTERTFTLTLSYDELLVVSDWACRVEDRDELRFDHPAEWIAWGKLSGQLEKGPDEVFSPDYAEIVTAARKRLSRGFEGHVKGVGWVRVEDDGALTRIEPQDDRGAN